MQNSVPIMLKIFLNNKKKRMIIEPFPITYQRKRAPRKRPFSSSGVDESFFKGLEEVTKGGCDVEKHHLPDPEERQLSEKNSPFLQFPRGPRSRKRIMTSDGVSVEDIPKEDPCPKSSITPPQARQKGRKRKPKAKDDLSDSEVIIPRRTLHRGRVGRCQDSSKAITDDRGKLDSAIFIHYFMHIWNAFPAEKVNSVAYFDPLWFDLYANGNKRSTVLKWIKKKDIFSKKYVLVPIVMWSHWNLLILCNLGENLDSKTNAPCMLLLDSLQAIGPSRLEVLIRRLLLDVYKSEERTENIKQLKKTPLLIPEVPQQNKGEECGFYVLYYISLFLESAPESFNISEGYPYFMNKDWFNAEGVESFYKRLDTIPIHDDNPDGSDTSDSSDCVELIDKSQFDECNNRSS